MMRLIMVLQTSKDPFLSGKTDAVHAGFVRPAWRFPRL